MADGVPTTSIYVGPVGLLGEGAADCSSQGCRKRNEGQGQTHDRGNDDRAEANRTTRHWWLLLGYPWGTRAVAASRQADRRVGTGGGQVFL